MELVGTKLTQLWFTRTCKQYSQRKQRTKITRSQNDWNVLTKESRKEYKCAYNKYIRDNICPDFRNNQKGIILLW